MVVFHSISEYFLLAKTSGHCEQNSSLEAKAIHPVSTQNFWNVIMLQDLLCCIEEVHEKDRKQWMSCILQGLSWIRKGESEYTRLTRRMKSCFSVQERIISATVFINWSPVYLQVSRVTAGLRLGETNACHDSLSLPGSRPSSRLLEYAGIQGLIVWVKVCDVKLVKRYYA